MTLAQHKTEILVFTLILALLAASPGIQQLVVLPQSTPISELALLGSQHSTSDYPSNIVLGEKYTVFLDVKNNLGYAANYMIQVKLLSQTQLSTDTQTLSLHNVTFFLADEQMWELPVVFSLNYSYDNNLSQVNVHMRNMTFNDVTFDARNLILPWDPERGGYLGYLVFELWIYNATLGDFENNGRSVNLVLNMT